MSAAFVDRNQAGAALAMELSSLDPPAAAVASISRGGLIVATPVSGLLGIPLTLIHARELLAPLPPRLPFGALDEDGHAVVDYPLVGALRLDGDEIESIKRSAFTAIRRRQALYDARPLADFLPAKRVVLVAEGLSNGLRMDAAVAYARRHGAAEVIVAVPCASSYAAARLRGSADRLVTLVIDPDFGAVGSYYADFPRVTDEEVLPVVSRRSGTVSRQPRK
jgi:putative phosphoribosyl transferase